MSVSPARACSWTRSMSVDAPLGYLLALRRFDGADETASEHPGARGERRPRRDLDDRPRRDSRGTGSGSLVHDRRNWLVKPRPLRPLG